MIKYILQRIGFAILTILVISLVVYILVAQFSENTFAAQYLNAGSNKPEIEKIYIQRSIDFHIIPDKDLNSYVGGKWLTEKLNPLARFVFWIKSVFDSKAPFGTTFDGSLISANGAKNIPDFFFKFLRYSIIITLPAFVISAILGVLLGIFAGYKRGSLFDNVINAFSLFFIALPSFVIAPILISILLTQNIPPIFYAWDPQRIQTDGWSRIITSWLPPILIIVLGSLSGYITYTRNQVITVLTSNYVLIAKSKGLGTIEIFFKYVFRNISIPLAARIIPSYIWLLSGGIVIETYWKVPGTSRIIAAAFPTGEINLIMFNTFFFTTLGVFTEILVDISFAFLDPRIKYSASSKRSFIQQFKANKIRKRKFMELATNATT
ncbi:ABC transporter permease [Mycoplasma crocodyli]|uniref:Oligopeptide ABC transporter, permease protein OppB n=1 Tax=Mycoplasma crocodyli (strain ATCC 51981 / MP145) TaxID=512564 RepID=D5E635_MYCCM|nr:ABC transporter permease [Mycoplasma crocodyli]ADE19483.1 oligopeptide ABC transporter, permease protein OppB [Mycoplasma crocodyli MP145]